MCALVGRLIYLMVYKADYYGDGAIEVRERERKIKARRGSIKDRNGVVLASNKSVCTVSVIYSQITDKEKVISVLSKELAMNESDIRKRVEKISSIEKIKSNVDKVVADRIRNYNMDGVMIDEDYKRTYPFNDLASTVLGFTGSDNQGIIGLEVKYDKYLKGKEGIILTTTTANGIELDKEAERRVEPEEGYNVITSLDYNIQKYAQYLAEKAKEEKRAKSVKITVMNPNNGEIYAMVNVPEFNLNEPYEYNGDKSIYETSNITDKNNLLNDMWRNKTISDTYEPGSTFKIVTAASAFEEGVLKVEDRFNCPGYKVVEDRRIRCHKVGGHGAEDFRQGIMNSCNPVFIDVGLRLTPKKMYSYYKKLGLFNKTGIDIPGEANSIMHKVENIKAVEQATMAFGQSIQITPLQLLVAVSAVVNGGEIVTPHFVTDIVDEEGTSIETFRYSNKNNVVTSETSSIMKELLEAVVAEGTGNKAYVEGLRIGGKTATSEKLPRRTGRYISSFLGVMPINNPQIIAIVLIDEPVGVYYGGTIATPIIANLFKNIANNGNSSLIMLE
ncbi:MAG: peptidoglycan glycosyltransferase [Lachnospiraceae bacterium]|nr:peptidoglycan glycosyltransferase [Lachnospiraceae bacterium]